MKPMQQDSLREAFQKTKNHSSEILEGLLTKLNDNNISYQTNSKRTEIIINDATYDTVKPIVEEYRESSPLLSDLLNIVISVNNVGDTTVIRLKYA